MSGLAAAIIGGAIAIGTTAATLGSKAASDKKASDQSLYAQTVQNANDQAIVADQGLVAFASIIEADTPDFGNMGAHSCGV